MKRRFHGSLRTSIVIISSFVFISTCVGQYITTDPSKTSKETIVERMTERLTENHYKIEQATMISVPINLNNEYLSMSPNKEFLHMNYTPSTQDKKILKKLPGLIRGSSCKTLTAIADAIDQKRKYEEPDGIRNQFLAGFIFLEILESCDLYKFKDGFKNSSFNPTIVDMAYLVYDAPNRNRVHPVSIETMVSPSYLPVTGVRE